MPGAPFVVSPGLFGSPVAVDGASAALDTALPTGWTWGSTSAMASSDFRIAAPMAVPGLVLRLLRARSSALRFVVGGTASSA